MKVMKGTLKTLSAMISKDQRRRLEEDGFVVIKNVLDQEKDLDPVLDEFAGVLDRLAKELLRNGQISTSYDDLPFGKRLIQIIEETGESHSQHFDFSLPKGQVGATAPMWLGDAILSMITNERLLDCVQDIIGPEIYSNPVQHVRLKPPERVVPKNPKGMSVLVGETPWHQDNAVLTQDADDTDILTVWIPLVDATVENGCLIVVPGSHHGPLAQHCSTGNGVLQIPEALIEREKVIPVPVSRGSILMFHRKLMHASFPNLSDRLRSSLDLRYQPIGQPTGREAFPGFVARSRSDPSKETRNREQWESLWNMTRERMCAKDYVEEPFDRWRGDHLRCAWQPFRE